MWAQADFYALSGRMDLERRKQNVPHLTMLAEMLDSDLEHATDQLVELGITHLDLKGDVFGRSIEELDDERRQRLASLVDRTGVEVYCFSSTLGHLNVDATGEGEFRERMGRGIENMLQTVKYVQPRMIRLLACTLDARGPRPDNNLSLERRAPWVFSAYQDAIDHILHAGIQATIENEPNSVLSSPDATVAFFDRLNLGTKVGFTWDVQNMWQSGTYPTLDAYRVLCPIINYVHLKGGRASRESPRKMTYRSSLEDASWPVVDIVREVISDGCSPVICLNASHGVPEKNDLSGNPDGKKQLTREEAHRDVAFLRERFQEIS